MSSCAGSFTRSAASFFPSAVHSLTTSATSSAYTDPLMTQTAALSAHTAIPRLRTIMLLYVPIIIYIGW